MSEWINRVHFGDCLETLRRMPDGIVQTCVTSPPYFGLRDYGHPGQIGLEASPEEFVAKLVDVFREVRRVLRDDGTCWVNMGDSYAGSGRGGNSEAITGTGKDESKKARGSKLPAGMHAEQVRTGALGRAWVPPPAGLKQKDLIGVPWMLAFALRADGWYLRQDIIWAKPNPMPESTEDRCCKAHEYIFLLSKSRRYYFDFAAIQEPSSPESEARYERGRSDDHKWADGGPGGQSIAKSFDGMRRNSFARVTKDSPGEHGQKPQFREDREPIAYEGVRRKRSVWNVSTKGYPGAHFATFPPDLIEPCVLAGAPAGGVVLDPFFGSGTTGEVAQRLGRAWIGLELNPEYEPLQRERLRQPGLIFDEAA